jgi:hypothetical protein
MIDTNLRFRVNKDSIKTCSVESSSVLKGSHYGFDDVVVVGQIDDDIG